MTENKGNLHDASRMVGTLLPPSASDLLCRVFQYCSTKDKVNWQRVCHYWCKTIRHSSSWTTVELNHGGRIAQALTTTFLACTIAGPNIDKLVCFHYSHSPSLFYMINRCPALKSFTLTDECDEDATHIVKHLPSTLRLLKLRLPEQRYEDEEEAFYFIDLILTRFPLLETLDMTSAYFSYGVLGNLTHTSPLLSLRHLTLWSYAGIELNQFIQCENFFALCPNLESFSTNIVTFPNENVTALINSCSKLSCLRLSHTGSGYLPPDHLPDAKIEFRDTLFEEVILTNSAFPLYPIELYLSTPLSDKTCAYLASCTASNIYVLDLTACGFTDMGLDVLTKACTNLIVFKARHDRVHHRNHDEFRRLTDAGCNYLARCVKLEEIELSGQSRITNVGMGYIADACKCLRQLNVQYCVRVTSQGRNRFPTHVNIVYQPL